MTTVLTGSVGSGTSIAVARLIGDAVGGKYIVGVGTLLIAVAAVGIGDDTIAVGD
jgi:hypothetical protein